MPPPRPSPDNPPQDPGPRFVSRGGLKLRHALDAFALSPAGLRCADFGCNVGGFTDCLLQAGAAHVIALDTGYGALAWTLRNDPRVTVSERTNALYAPPPPPDERPELIVIDMGWTTQAKCIPAALAWLATRGEGGAGEGGRIITLIKPHYEHSAGAGSAKAAPVLDVHHAQEIVERVLAEMPALGARVLASTRSPIDGGAGKGNKAGNAEWLALLAPIDPSHGVGPTHSSGVTADGS